MAPLEAIFCKKTGVAENEQVIAENEIPAGGVSRAFLGAGIVPKSKPKPVVFMKDVYAVLCTRKLAAGIRRRVSVRLIWLLLMCCPGVLGSYTALAQDFKWGAQIGAEGEDANYGMAVDDAGNIYLTGTFSSTVDFDPGPGTVNLTSAGGTDIYILKMSSAGSLIWARRFGSTGDDAGNQLDVTPAGDIYASGSFSGVVDFDPGSGTTQLDGANGGAYILKLTTDGTFSWVRQFDVNAPALSVQPSGIVYLTGTFDGTVDLDPGPGSLTFTAGGLGDIFIAKLAATGSLLWAKHLPMVALDENTSALNRNLSHSIDVDGAGNAYITGLFRGSVDFDAGAGEHILTRRGARAHNIFSCKYSTDGVFRWARQIESSHSIGIFSINYSVVVDEPGNVYLAGTFSGISADNTRHDPVDFDPGPGAFRLTNTTSTFDVFVSKLDGAGNFIWARQLQGNALIGERFKIRTDAGGNVFLAGSYKGVQGTSGLSADLDPGPGTYSINFDNKVTDIFVVRLDNLVLTSATTSTSACAGSTAGLSVSVTGGEQPYSYTWSAPAGISLPANTNTSALSGTISAGTTGLQTLTVTVAGQGGFPVSSTTVSVSVIAPPSVSITANPSPTIVSGNTVTLTASGAQSYTWTGGSTDNSFTAAPATTTVYSVTGINISGCTDIESITVTVKSISCGSVIYVTQSGAGIQDGSSWSNALPGRRLQNAIDAAATCGGAHQVWVAAGTYTPTSTTARDISFSMRNNVAIYGGFAGSETALSGRNPSANPTILSGETGNPGLGDNSYNVIFNSNLDNTARLDGFVITDGNGTGSVNADAGGGIRNNEGSPVIANCIFRGNQAEYGGAFYSQNAGNPTLTNCVFLNNTALTGGGAISLYANSPVLTNCSFQGNSSPDGGVIHTPGGGSPVLTNCVLFNNGGNEPFAGGTPQLSYCLLPPDVASYISGPGNLTTRVSPFVSAVSVMLTICAPAINAGLTSAPGLSGITTDVSGNPRIFEGRVDMGAYEFQSAAPAITITASPSLTITPGSVVTLAASGAVSYTWTGGSTGSSFTALPETNTVYSVTGVTGSGCTVIQSTTITINPIPCAPVIYITESGAGTRNGSSWANAMPGNGLQFALDQAAGCGGARQIWVARGTYTPTGRADRDISFAMSNNVALYGGFVGSETALSGRPAVNPLTGHPSNTTLSGEIGDPATQADNSQHIINNPAGFGLNSSALLDGFVITGGSSSSYGAGMYNDGSSPTVQNCLFVDNSGGGMYNLGSSPSLLNCMFQHNTAVVTGGGGMYNDAGSNVLMTNCRFLHNTTGNRPLDGGAILNTFSSFTLVNSSLEGNTAPSGGAFTSYSSTVSVQNCDFLGNSAQVYGGAIEIYYSSLTITNSRLQDNSASIGGALDIITCNASLINCSLLNNTGTNGGGAILNYYTELDLTNCSLQGNRSLYGGAINNVKETATLTNCVLFDNGAENTFYNDLSGRILSNYSLFDQSVTTYTAVNSLTTTVSPFASTTGTELAPCSPAINAGTNSASGLTGITTDLAGNPRRYGNGIVDMGAYEFQGEGKPASFTVLGSGTATCAASPTITLSGSETGVSYQLQRNGANSGTAVAGTGSAIAFGPQSQAGIYTVLATRSNCTQTMAESATVVSSTAVISASLVASGTISCNTPSVTLTAVPANLTYSFGSGSSRIGQTNQATVNAAGTYSVTVTDAGGCSAVSQVTVTGNTTAPTGATLTASFGGTLTCGQPALTLTAGATGSGLTYSFSGPGILVQSGTSATINAAGTYSVVITGSNGCTTSAMTTIYSNTIAPTVSLSPTSATLTCTSPAVILTATAGYATYAFTGGQPGTANTLLVNAAGTYSVVVTAANGCTALSSATVVSSTATPSLSVNPSSATAACASQAVSLSAIGSGTVRWSTGQTGPVISVSLAGPYSVTLTDGGGCTAVAGAVVSVAQVGAVTVTAGGGLGCGVLTTTVRVAASGATSYTLSGPGGYGQTNSTGVFSVSAGGSYTGLAGQAGCVASNTVVVLEGGAQPVISSIQASGTIGNGSCSVSVQGAGYGDRYMLTGPSGYVFSVLYRTAGDHSVSFPDVVKPGTYTLTVYSGNCVVSRTVTVSGTACP